MLMRGTVRRSRAEAGVALWRRGRVKVTGDEELRDELLKDE
jgi:hypothetical protein